MADNSNMLDNKSQVLPQIFSLVATDMRLSFLHRPTSVFLQCFCFQKLLQKMVLAYEPAICAFRVMLRKTDDPQEQKKLIED